MPLALIVYLILGAIALVLGLILGWLGALLISFLSSIVGTFWLQGAFVEAVAGRARREAGPLARRDVPRASSRACPR